MKFNTYLKHHAIDAHEEYLAKTPRFIYIYIYISNLVALDCLHAPVILIPRKDGFERDSAKSCLWPGENYYNYR